MLRGQHTKAANKAEGREQKKRKTDPSDHQKCSNSAIKNATAKPDGKIRPTDEIVDRFLDVQTDEATSGAVGRTLTPIDALPVELLTQILHHAILADAHRCDVHRHRKQELASVSRRWRDTILDDPSFWTTINLTPQWTPSLVETHVQRSGRLLVDIEIRLWQGTVDFRTLPLLVSIAMDCSDRWRSLVLDQNAVVVPLIVGQMRDTIFPSLAYIVVGYQLNYPRIFGFEPGKVPALNFLRINSFCPSRLGTFSFPPNLRILDVTFEVFILDHLSLALPSEKLTTLVLRGDNRGWTLVPVHSPHLTSLTLATVQPKQLLDCIVAPQLRHFCYLHNSTAGGPIYPVFAELKNKFTTVTNLDIRLPADNAELAIIGHIIVDAFPGVRHLVLLSDDLPAFFGQHDSEEQSPADRWCWLERLTLHWSRTGRDTSNLVSWLQRRNCRGQTMLHVQLAPAPEYENHVLATHLLSECCVLETKLDDFGPDPGILPRPIHQYYRIARERKLSDQNCGTCRTDDIARQERDSDCRPLHVEFV